MLPALPDLIARPAAGGYLLVQRGAPRAGYIRYTRCVRPLATISQIIEDRLAGLRVENRGEVHALYTDEGEYAARVSLAGMHGPTSVQRELGLVFGDDAYAIADATCIDAAHARRFATAVTELVRGLRFGRPGRRRRYRYAAPPDRRAQVRGLETDWIADDDTLTVFPAERAGLDQATAIAARGGLAIGLSDHTESTIITASSPDRWRAVAATTHGGWLYAMELVALAPRPLGPLIACLRSIDPLPAPRALSLPALFEVD